MVELKREAFDSNRSNPRVEKQWLCYTKNNMKRLSMFMYILKN